MFGDCISGDIKNLRDIENLCNYRITKRALALKLLEKLDCNDTFFNKMEVDNKNCHTININFNKKEKINEKKISINLADKTPDIEIKIEDNELNCKNSYTCKSNDLYNEIIEKAKKELREASHHLSYEFSGLIDSYSIFNNLKGICVKDKCNLNLFINLINNMRIESLRIHIRTLIEFFKILENDKNNKKDRVKFDDISYNDFFCLDHVINVQSQKSFTPSFSDNIDIIKRKINLTTAHLSYIRVDQSKDDREPNLEEIKKVINEINNNMYDFYNAVDKDLLSDYSKEVFKNHFKNNNENNK